MDLRLSKLKSLLNDALNIERWSLVVFDERSAVKSNKSAMRNFVKSVFVTIHNFEVTVCVLVNLINLFSKSFKF